MSFALNPEAEPSGQCNLSHRLDGLVIHVQPQLANENYRCSCGRARST